MLERISGVAIGRKEESCRLIAIILADGCFRYREQMIGIDGAVTIGKCRGDIADRSQTTNRRSVWEGFNG